jgi:hypothetical protein
VEKLDLKKDFKHLLTPSTKAPQLVEVPRLNFLRVDGAIEPGHGPGDSPRFAENMQALYSAAYTLKFMLKQRPENPIDYPVITLEGLWWVEDGRFDIQIKDNWFYTVQIMQPECVAPDQFAEALVKLRKKKGNLEAFSRLRLESFHEGLSVQMLHLGPYAAEPATVEKMDAYIQAEGLQKTGKHHEIYLGNPLLADPSKLKTILRHPVTKCVKSRR